MLEKSSNTFLIYHHVEKGERKKVVKIRVFNFIDSKRIITIDGNEDFKMFENDDKIVLIFNKNHRRK
jgi:hypothetical protein